MSVQTLESMVNWVEAHAVENPRLEELSAFFGYSPFYCSVQFRRFAGVTMKKYVARVKVETAAKQLCSGEKRILDIAMDCGYSSHEAFARAFAGRFFCSPGEYRRRRCGEGSTNV